MKVYTRNTYFGSTTESKAALSSFLLERPKNSFVPRECYKYAFLMNDLSGFLIEGNLPETVCVGLLISRDLPKEEAGVVIWFQNVFFEDPSEVLSDIIAKIRWKDTSESIDLYS